MKRTGRKITGIILILFATVSLGITLYGVVQVWQMKEPIKENLISNLEIFESTLENTADGLVIAHQSMDSVSASMDGLENTVGTLADSIDDTIPLINSLESLTGETLPETIQSTQSSLAAAGESAKIIDSVLRALTIFNRNLYNPAEPLDVALGKVSVSMDDLPETLDTMETSLKDTSDNLLAFQAEIRLAAKSIKDINQGLEEAGQVIESYQESVDILLAEISGYKTRLPRWIDGAAWMLTFLLIWLAIVQLVVLVIGWQMTRTEDDSGGGS